MGVLSVINGVLGVIGALALFLFGMKIMSEGLQRAAGDELRQMMQRFTENRFAGLLIGTLVTLIIQSSSATTVMVVSFVNSGLLSLTESVGVLMGANIGTTVTAWLVTFIGKLNLAKYALIIIAVSFPFLFIKGQKSRYLLEIIVGFGVLFMGLGALKESMPDIENFPMVNQWILAHADGSFTNRILFVFAGTLITILLQSSSATMALTLTFITDNDLPIEIAVALVLGENIGTTITAILASLIGNVNAKRTSRIHLLFNLFGVFWMFFLMPFFIDVISGSLVPFMSKLMPSVMSIETHSDLSRWTLTVFHSVFNILNAAILIWFVAPLVMMAKWMVPDGELKKIKQLPGGIIYFADQIIGNVEVATIETGKKINEMVDLTKDIFKTSLKIHKTSDPFNYSKLLEKVEKKEKESDKYEENISSFLLQVSQNDLTKEETSRILQQFDVIQNLEEIGDIAKLMSHDFYKLSNQHPFPDEYDQKMTTAGDMLLSFFDYIIDNFYSVKHLDKETSLDELKKINRDFHLYCKKVRKELIKSIRKERKLNYRAAGTVRDILGKMDSISTHLFKVGRASVIVDDDDQLDDQIDE